MLNNLFKKLIFNFFYIFVLALQSFLSLNKKNIKYKLKEYLLILNLISLQLLYELYFELLHIYPKD